MWFVRLISMWWLGGVRFASLRVSVMEAKLYVSGFAQS